MVVGATGHSYRDAPERRPPPENYATTVGPVSRVAPGGEAAALEAFGLRRRRVQRSFVQTWSSGPTHWSKSVLKEASSAGS